MKHNRRYEDLKNEVEEKANTVENWFDKNKKQIFIVIAAICLVGIVFLETTKG